MNILSITKKRLRAKKMLHRKSNEFARAHADALESWLNRSMPAWHRWLLRKFPSWANRLLGYEIVSHGTAPDSPRFLARHGKLIAGIGTKEFVNSLDRKN